MTQQERKQFDHMRELLRLCGEFFDAYQAGGREVHNAYLAVEDYWDRYGDELSFLADPMVPHEI